MEWQHPQAKGHGADLGWAGACSRPSVTVAGGQSAQQGPAAGHHWWARTCYGHLAWALLWVLALLHLQVHLHLGVGHMHVCMLGIGHWQDPKQNPDSNGIQNWQTWT